MSVNQMDACCVACDWRDCHTTLENLTERDVQRTLTENGWEIDGSLLKGANTYCPEHAWTDEDN